MAFIGRPRTVKGPKKVTFNLSDLAVKRLKAAAELRGMPESELLRKILESMPLEPKAEELVQPKKVFPLYL